MGGSFLRTTVLCQVLAIGAIWHPLFQKNKLEKWKIKAYSFLLFLIYFWEDLLVWFWLAVNKNKPSTFDTGFNCVLLDDMQKMLLGTYFKKILNSSFVSLSHFIEACSIDRILIVTKAADIRWTWTRCKFICNKNLN